MENVMAVLGNMSFEIVSIMFYAIRYQISFCNYIRDHNQQIKKMCLGAQEKQISFIYSP